MPSTPLGDPISTLNEASAVDGTEKIPFVQNTRTKWGLLSLVADWILTTYAGFTQSGSEATSRDMQSKAREVISAQDYAGATDDLKITRALARVSALGGGEVIWAAGSTCTLAAKVTVPSRCVLDMRWATVSAEFADFAFSVESGEYGGEIRNLYADGNQFAGGSGVYLQGVNSRLVGFKLDSFKVTSLQLGEAGTAGSYFNRVSEGYIHMPDGESGTTALLIDGQSTPNSNANIVDNVQIGGQFTTWVHIKGNNNVLTNVSPAWRDAAAGSKIFLIEGVQNKVSGAYTEAADSTTPDYLVHFTSTAVGNEVELGLVWSTTNVDPYILDDGTANKVTSSFRGATTSAVIPNSDGIQNLLPNSSFKVWRTSTNPAGWQFATARASKETEDGIIAIRFDESASNSNVECHFQDYFDADLDLPIEKFIGKTITFGAEIWSDYAGPGVKVLDTESSAGSATHTGDSTWQYLTATYRINDAATRCWVDFRTDIANAAKTGICKMRRPVAVFGTHLSRDAYRAIADGGNRIYGDLDFVKDAIADTNSALPIIHGQFVWFDTNGRLRRRATRPTAFDTDGHLITQGWVSADQGNDSELLLWGTDATTAVWGTTFTVTNRTADLSTSNAVNGSRFRIVRKATAVGAFRLDVGVGPLTSLAAGEWCEVEYDGSAWFLAARGPMGKQAVSADNGNAAATLTVGASEMTQRWETTLTADRAVTLNTGAARTGDRFRIVRTADGAFNLNVGTGPLAALVQDEWCDVEYNGSAWILTAKGSLA